ncbi:MAG: hypothetical protein JWP14_190 [Frankiales bacterium]|nr:hypothetical protein [Frankiales bacterium]
MTEQVGWAPTRSGAVFTGLHLPVEDVRATAVVLVPPFGWEGVSAGRNLRAWARELAAAGYPTLRYQPPGAGDSSGTGADQDLTSWSAALVDLVALLRQATGCSQVTVVGLGLGGLVALQASAEGAELDDLVLWAAPGRGRHLLRELRAFAALTAEPGAAPPGTTKPIETVTGEDGVLWVHGYPLGVRAQNELIALDAGELDLSRVRRALLLGRGTLPIDRKLVDALTAAGSEVLIAPGRGIDELTVEPRLSKAPLEVMSVVLGWLRPDPGRTTTGPPLFASNYAEERLSVGDADAVVTRARAGEASLTAVFLSAGAIPRSGPNRLWAEAARRWADLGVASVRVDLHDIGEAGGPAVFPRGPEGLYDVSYRREIAGVLDAAVAAGLPDSFLTVGLCSGGYWAVDAAVHDARVVATACLNGSLVWPPPLGAVSKRAFFNRGTMLRVIRDGRLRREVLLWIMAQIRLVHRRLWRASSGSPLTPAQVVTALERDGTLLAVAASPGETVLQQMQALLASPGVLLRPLEGPVGAHTMAPVGLRAQAEAFLDEVVTAALARQSARLAAK